MQRYIGRHKRGFTLVEMVIAILISGIIAVGVVTYIGDTINGFVSSGDRNKLASSGRVVVDRIAMELHNAVPNSIRVTAAQPNGDQCMEFIPFLGASNYLSAPFTGLGGTTVRSIDFNPPLLLASGAEEFAVIYPINTAGLYDVDNRSSMAPLDSIVDTGGADGIVTITLDAAHRFPRRSPVDRIYIAQDPVSFCVVGSQLYRYSNYGVALTQCTPTTNSCEVGSPLPDRRLPSALPDRVLISDRLDNTDLTAFSLMTPTLRRNAIVSMELNFTENNDIVRLKHEVLMRNAP
jgi:MSHA biogenesis protein MshO